MSPHSLAVRVLADPQAAAPTTEAGWDLLVRQARRAGLLPRVATVLHDAGVTAPAAAQRHLDVARALAAVQREEVLREVRLLMRTLAPLAVPVVLLKGAAYAVGGFAPSQARLFADIDILVPKERLGEVEALLMTCGWATTSLSAYDQRYYRRWMHELPPMVHTQRQTTLDIHHNILPLTARQVPDARLLFAAARPVDDVPGLFVPAPEDLVLHSLCHLLHNDDLRHALRDLSDVDLLLRDFGREPGFWSRLQDRAQALRLQRPLADGLRQAHRVFATPMPEDLRRGGPGVKRGGLRHALLDALWRHGLQPQHASCETRATGAARLALYVRAHWLRMPPLLLAAHLTVKALGLHEWRQRPRPVERPAAADAVVR